MFCLDSLSSHSVLNLAQQKCLASILMIIVQICCIIVHNHIPSRYCQVCDTSHFPQHTPLHMCPQLTYVPPTYVHTCPAPQHMCPQHMCPLTYVPPTYVHTCPQHMCIRAPPPNICASNICAYMPRPPTYVPPTYVPPTYVHTCPAPQHMCPPTYSPPCSIRTQGFKELPYAPQSIKAGAHFRELWAYSARQTPETRPSTRRSTTVPPLQWSCPSPA